VKEDLKLKSVYDEIEKAWIKLHGEPGVSELLKLCYEMGIEGFTEPQIKKYLLKNLNLTFYQNLN